MSVRGPGGAAGQDRVDRTEAEQVSGEQPCAYVTPQAAQGGGGAPPGIASRTLGGDGVLAAVLCGERELGKGERGEHVRKLQDALTSLTGRPVGKNGSDGVFGVETEREVMAFQRQCGLNPTGRLDLATIEELDAKLVQGPEQALARKEESLRALTGAPKFDNRQLAAWIATSYGDAKPGSPAGVELGRLMVKVAREQEGSVHRSTTGLLEVLGKLYESGTTGEPGMDREWLAAVKLALGGGASR